MEAKGLKLNSRSEFRSNNNLALPDDRAKSHRPLTPVLRDGVEVFEYESEIHEDEAV